MARMSHNDVVDIIARAGEGARQRIDERMAMFRRMVHEAHDLDDLRAALNHADRTGWALNEIGVDLTKLPRFGGVEPQDTTGIWSWDEGRFLIHIPDEEAPRGRRWEIIRRCQYDLAPTCW